MTVVETITQPWRNPVDYARLAFWVAIFAVVAFVIFDGVWLFATGVKSAAAKAADAV